MQSAGYLKTALEQMVFCSGMISLLAPGSEGPLVLDGVAKPVGVA